MAEAGKERAGGTARRGTPARRWVCRLLAVAAAMLALSGAALVWPDAIDRVVHPARFATRGAAVLAPDLYLDAARRRAGAGRRVASLTLPAGRGPVVIGVAPGNQRIFVDPATARVLDVATDDAWLRRLHRGSLVPGGRFVVGAIGVAVISWAAGALWRRSRSGRARATAGGRRTSGFRFLPLRGRGFANRSLIVPAALLLLPLAALVMTGTWLAFAEPDAPVADILPLAEPGQPVAAIMARARTVAPGRVRRVDWPGRHRPDWTVTLSGGAVVKVADDTAGGSAAVSRETRGGAGLIRRLHDGTGMETVWRIAMVMAGVLPVLWVGWRRLAAPPRRGRGRSSVG